MDSTATGPPAASSRARRTAALLNGAPEDASSTAAGAVGCVSQQRRENTMSVGPGYLTTGGSPEASEPAAGPAVPAPDSSGALAAATATAGAPAPARLRSCARRHQYSGAYRATMSRPSR